MRRVSTATRRDHSPLPYSVDWAARGKMSPTRRIAKPVFCTQGAVTPVVDQSPCNSCAAHAATATIEACYWKVTGYTFINLHLKSNEFATMKLIKIKVLFVINQ